MTRIRNVALLCFSILVLTVTGCNSEYDQGYRQGVQDVRETRQTHGVIGEAGMQLIDHFGVAGRPERSEEWNRGYREGAHAELQK
jgi:hypothetical protein